MPSGRLPPAMYAAPATSASVMPLSGEPAHGELAVAQLDVLRRGLELVGDDLLAPCRRTFSVARATASPPTASEREP